MKSIKYLIHYDVDNSEGRCCSKAAVNKGDYIAEAIINIGCSVKIISASMVSSIGCFKKSVTELGVNKVLLKFQSVTSGNFIQKVFAKIYRNVILFFYLIFNLKKDDSIIVYHSLDFMNCVRLAKKIKGFELILEVEEIYNDVIKKSVRARQRELNFISCADKYIFPTEMLNELLNKENKPYSVVHGTYKIEQNRNVDFNDEKIHVVYAGTFDPRKGGATAAAAAEWLPEKYHVHILGFGSDEDTEYIKKQINETNSKAKATVTYDGLLSGEGYIQFLQKCQIGLSTQNPDADFNDTSFPSKILSYMANGLRVVTVRIPAIESSAVGQDVYYYDKQTPQAIAEAVMKIDLSDGYDGRKRIKELDNKFQEDIKRILEV